jgi:hypothetical protein
MPRVSSKSPRRHASLRCSDRDRKSAGRLCGINNAHPARPTNARSNGSRSGLPDPPDLRDSSDLRDPLDLRDSSDPLDLRDPLDPSEPLDLLDPLDPLGQPARPLQFALSLERTA